MSEIAAALNPEVEAETPVAEAPQEETPVAPEETPDYGKLIQREQMERANLRRDIERKLDGIMDAIKSANTIQAPAARQSKLDAIQQRLKGVEGQTLAAQSPELASFLTDLTEELAETRKGTSEISTLRERQEAIDAFEAYMEDKPAGFREAFTKQQRAYEQKYADRGLKVNRQELRLLMDDWGERYLEGKKTAQPATPKAPGVNRIVPAQGGARQKVDAAKPRDPFGLARK